MATETMRAPSKWESRGWWLLLALSLLLALNGVALYFISASPATFEQDTGVSFAEVQTAFPTVAEHVVREGQILAVLLAVIGLMASVASWAGLRKGAGWAKVITGILVAMLAVFAVRFLVFDGRLDIGGFYLALAVLALIGQALAGRSRTR